MFNMPGEAIGIASPNISKSGGSDGLGFVVTIDTAKLFLIEKQSFLETREVLGRLPAIVPGRPHRPSPAPAGS